MQPLGQQVWVCGAPLLHGSGQRVKPSFPGLTPATETSSWRCISPYALALLFVEKHWGAPCAWGLFSSWDAPVLSAGLQHSPHAPSSVLSEPEVFFLRFLSHCGTNLYSSLCTQSAVTSTVLPWRGASQKTK